jgi:hypothetical protein
MDGTANCSGITERRNGNGNITEVVVVRAVEVDGKRYLSKGIGTSAFISCPIKSIGIPSNAEVIGEQCFSW